MELQTVSADCVALLVHSPVRASEDAAALVRSALVLAGLAAWPRMEVELFPSGDGALILARPAPELEVRVADWALPFFRK